MLKVVVTGASGFIGHRLVNLLHNAGFLIHILSRRKHSLFNTSICDLEKEAIPIEALKGVDIIFHLAGHAHDSSDSLSDGHLYRTINVDATIKLAKLAVKSHVKKFVFISSVKAGGRPPIGTCANEDSQGVLYDIYGKMKHEAELKLLDIGKTSDMHISIVRPSLVYGPNVKGNLQLMLAGVKKGWFPPLPETGNRRSMIHVDDLVRAIFMIAEDKRANGKVFIATDGKPYSSREIYNTMREVTGKSIPKWSLPKILFNIASLVNYRIKYKINKLLGDECYSSAKLESLGFEAKKTLKDMNETDF